MKRIKRFGWTPDLPDQRDLRYFAKPTFIKKIPAKINLTQNMPSIFDQGNLGSCTANAISTAFQFCMRSQKITREFTPSRLFIYYNERVMINTINEDSGAMIRDGFKSINKQGVCSEKQWPYTISKFTQKPNLKCYSEAEKNQAIQYRRVQQSLPQLKACLAEGFPFVFGFTVYDSFESQSVARTGTLNLPKDSEGVIGGHAVLAVGYDDKTQRFLIRNSWGEDWGKKGYFTMPYEYLTNNSLADDFWMVSMVEE